MADLNALLAPGSNLNLIEADFITDQGLIVARGFTPTGDVHTAILIPDGKAFEFTPDAVSGPRAATMPPALQRRLTGEIQRHLRKRQGFRPGSSQRHERLAEMHKRA